MSLNPFEGIRLTSRGAAEDLRRGLIDFLHQQRLEPGTRLPTEAEMLKHVDVSRSTLRRALKPLEKEGWITRRAGSGTFVGDRVRTPSIRPTRGAGEDAQSNATAATAARRRQGIIRAAVLIYNIGDLAHDWYTPGILQGLDDAGDEHRLVVELLGDRDSDVDSLARRLSLTQPDVLICLTNRLKHAFVLRDAQRHGIHCFTSGTPLRGLELPGVCEDNEHAMRLAMTHLAERGHRRIALVLPRVNEPWVFERLRVYSEQIADTGEVPRVLWTDREVNEADCAALLRLLRPEKGSPTALIPAHSTPMRMLDQLVRSRHLRVPEDVSLVSFEQDHVERAYLGQSDATRIVFPLREMGQTLADLARRAVAGESIEPTYTVLPSRLEEGETVATVEGK